jgi:hypothetical protein
MNYKQLVVFFCLIPLCGYSGPKEEDDNINFGCVTYVSNLTTDALNKQRDICYTIKLEEYTEASQSFRFTVNIVDNDKKSSLNLNNLYFKKRNESWQTIDYHIDDSWSFAYSNSFIQIKSLIYFKEEKKWCILFKENSDFKYFSFFRGYQFIDEFGVGSSKRINNQDSY